MALGRDKGIETRVAWLAVSQRVAPCPPFKAIPPPGPAPGHHIGLLALLRSSSAHNSLLSICRARPRTGCAGDAAGRCDGECPVVMGSKMNDGHSNVRFRHIGGRQSRISNPALPVNLLSAESVPRRKPRSPPATIFSFHRRRGASPHPFIPPAPPKGRRFFFTYGPRNAGFFLCKQLSH